ncbi:FecR family protein [Pedobacter hiemivivus]|uniref:FecR family protein n=1 Tax=Pedobacter hiemivivus TaxID=2530454 RepID=A0A4R0MF15_9SPHI|nr:FecR family protein [Pedobacter hiemivivus]TCC84482.1 FecR family protein [Pedobacter hiemivivus]
MDKQRAKELVQRYNQGLATAEEKALLENWYMQKSYNLHLEDNEIDFERIEGEIRIGTLDRAGLNQHIVKTKRFKLWPRIAIAASLILTVGVGLLYFVTESDSFNSAGILANRNDIARGSNKAILTLANGQKIVLTDAKNGELANEDDAIIRKTGEGQLVYDGKTANATESVFNTIATPRGGQYSLILSDGTKVILNAASSLKYPTGFKGKDRIVELEGEGYFEVAHNKAKPFKVISKGQTVEVLGTHFNINSYSDEPSVKTTLLEGSVNVNGSLLKPNQQAILTTDSKINVTNVDGEDAVAWKDGLFKFDHTDMRTSMRQIARWYDVEVVYEGNVKDEQFYGKIDRSYTLSEVLKVLKISKVNFRIEGRKIIVMPQGD